jgi:hypothetical protein
MGTGFVTSELLTDTWMRALSPLDVAAKDSDRTDHGPYGAYDGWPALTVAAFARLGNHTEAARFLTSTAFVTQLGPYGQAHGVADPYLGACYFIIFICCLTYQSKYASHVHLALFLSNLRASTLLGLMAAKCSCA